jgi:hypothetical protein
MPRSMIIVLTLIAGSWTSGVLAQNSNGEAADAGAAAPMPALIFPGTFTEPTTRGSDAEGATAAVRDPDTSTTPEAAPYSVEGEETLDPNSN